MSAPGSVSDITLRLALSALIALPQPLVPAFASTTEFTPAAPLARGYIGHGLLSHEGRLYNVGGLSSGGILFGDRVYVSDAGVTAWTETTRLPQPSLFHAAAIAGGHMFVLGGQKFGSGLQPSNAVVSAPLLAGGGVGAWTPTTQLPSTLFLHSVSVWNNRLYVLGGWSSSGLTNRVYVADVLAGGQLSAWTELEHLPEAVYTHSTVQNGHIYVLGGVKDGGSTVYNGVFFAEILADGTLGPWVPTTFLPEALSSHASVLYGRVFVTGGWIGDQPTSRVRSAAILADGHLGEWQDEPSLPEPLYRHGATVLDGKLYVSGGSNGNLLRSGVHFLELPPVVADILPPRTTLSVGAPKFGEAPTFITAASQLGLSAVDDRLAEGDALGQVAAINVSIDGGAFSSYAAPFSIAAEGVHTVAYYAADSIGNAEPQRSAALAVDLTAPVSSLSIGSPLVVLETGERILGPATPLNVSAADPVSSGVAVGVASAKYSIDGGPMTAAGADFFLPAADGPHTAATQAADHLGNTEAVRAETLYVDATAPATAVSAAPAPYTPPGGDPIYGAGNLLAFSASDPAAGGVASGVASTEYRLNGGAWTAVSGELALEEGVHALDYRSTDAVGNAEAVRSSTFRVDATAPATQLSVGSPVMSLFGADLITPASPISLTAQDPLSGGVQSGVKQIVYSIDAGPDQAYAAPFTLPAGAHTVSYGSVDNAGNAEARQTAFFSVASFLTDSVAGLSSVTLAGGAKVTGSVRSNGAFRASGKSEVEGDVAAMTIELNGKSTISGAATQGAATLPAPIDLAPLAAAAQASNNNAAIASHLQDGKLVLGSHEALTIPAGDYYLAGMELSGGAEVSLGGAVNIFAAGPISVTGGAALNKDGAAEDLWIFSSGASVSFSGQSRSAMNLYAPAADVSMSGGGMVAGRLLGDAMTLTGRSMQPSTAMLPARTRPGKAAKLAKRPARAVAAATSPHLGGQPKKIALHKKGAAPAEPSRQSEGTAVRPNVESRPKTVRSLGEQARKIKGCDLADLLRSKEASLSIVDIKGKAVRAFDRSAVVIPEGALASGIGVSVSVQESIDADELSRRSEDSGKKGIVEIGKPVEYGPHGTRFNVPVTLELPYVRADLPAGVDERALTIHYWNPSSGRWEALESVVDPANQLVTAKTSHFSVYQLFSSHGSNEAGARGVGFGEVYSFPNPAKAGQTPTIHAEAPEAERVEIRVYDIAGELKHSAVVGSPATVDDGSGPEAAFEYRLDASGLGSGIYIYVVTAIKGGEKISRTGKLALIK